VSTIDGIRQDDVKRILNKSSIFMVWANRMINRLLRL